VANTLDIDDEWGPVDVVIALERAFGLKLDDKDVRDVYTVGEMYDLLLKMVPRDGQGSKCATAMAFYSLRRVIARPGCVRLAPRSDLSFLEKGRTKRNWKNIENRSGLYLPSLGVAWPWLIGTTLAIMASAMPTFLVGVVLVFLSIPWGDTVVSISPVLLITGLVLTIIVAVIDPGKLPQEGRTLGGLAAKVAPRNYGQFVKAGAPISDAIIWKIMVEVLIDHSDLPSSQVTRETFFLRSAMKKAA